MRRERAHEADSRAADAHLVGGLQARGLGQRDFDVVGGDERQAVVGVVGQEHGDDHDQRRDRPDQERAAGEGSTAAPVHQGVSVGIAAQQFVVHERRGPVGGGLRRRAWAAAQLAGLQAFKACCAVAGVRLLFAPSLKSGKTGLMRA